MLRKITYLSVACALVVATLQISPVQADEVVVLGVRTENSACNAAFGVGANCFVSGGKITASTDGTKVEAINPITAYVGETIKITNQSGSHNMIFCKAGTVIPNNGGDVSKNWTCGDPISLVGGPDPECCQTASGPNAPEMIGYHPVETYPFSTTLNAAGDYYFWCGIGGHRKEGQYGKLVVKSGTRPTVEAAPSSTNKTPAAPESTSSTAAPASSVNTAATSSTLAKSIARPTLVLRKAKGKLLASGRAASGGRVVLQKQVGVRWVTVGSANAGKTGAYTITAKADPKPTSYRVTVGLRTSLTRRI